jgi:hypothetical protein
MLTPTNPYPRARALSRAAGRALAHARRPLLLERLVPLRRALHLFLRSRAKLYSVWVFVCLPYFWGTVFFYEGGHTHTRDYTTARYTPPLSRVPPPGTLILCNTGWEKRGNASVEGKRD